MKNMRVMIDRELTIADRLTVGDWQTLSTKGPIDPNRRHDERLAIAQKIADDARRRNTAICQCAGCQQERALPGVLRVLAQHEARVAIEKAMGEQNG